MKFYSLKRILAKKAKYNMIFGERSNGKTYAVTKYAIENFAKTGKQLALVRRWRDDFIGKRGKVMFDGLVKNDEISRATKGEWTDIYYYSSCWYFCKYDGDGKRVLHERPFCYAFALTSMEHDKSTSYPDVTTVLFDEFLTRSAYLPDEFVLFMNVLSTIIRYRDDVTIFMLGNTVNKYCPYFKEMGLTHVQKMEQGDIDVYKYGNSSLTVAVEYAAGTAGRKGKESDGYFAFDNPKLQMITHGTWEIDIYPHLPKKYRPKDIVFTYFIVFEENILQCEIVSLNNMVFTYIHRKTTPIKDEEMDTVFTLEYDARFNFHRKITKPITKMEKRVAEFFVRDKVFYQDNEVGEIVRNYLIACGKMVV